MREFTCLLIDDDTEDHEIVLTGLQRILVSIRFITARNGLEALTMLQSIYKKPDLILLDLNMPIMGGRQFLAEFNKLYDLKSIPVVVLTTSQAEKDQKELLRMGALDFFTKPNSVEEWEKMLNQIVTKYLS